MDALKNSDGSEVTVEFGGQKYTLTEHAWVDTQNGEVIYCASAVDASGDTYQVRWSVTDAWQTALDAEDEDHPLLQDEGEACDWDSPISVEPR